MQILLWIVYECVWVSLENSHNNVIRQYISNCSHIVTDIRVTLPYLDIHGH